MTGLGPDSDESQNSDPERGGASEGDEQPAAVVPSDPPRDEKAVAQASADKPSFAEAWPASVDLDRLLMAFERGNYAFVRSEAPKVAARATDPAVKAAALDLRRRINPAPLAGFLILAATGILVAVALHYLGKHDPSAPSAPMQPAKPTQPTNR